MIEIIGVRFKKAGKTYYFSPNGLKIEKGLYVVVETARAIEIGEVVIGNRMVDEKEIFSPLKPVIRIATEQDFKTLEENKQKEKEAFDICTKKIQEHNLDMKLVEVEYTFDQNKILFYFTADGRVDFRDLVKDLASIFKIRIELRQIGVRDEAKMLGGLGICGRPFCCHAFLGDFHPVSIKMAKEQNMSLNPTKISGICGRLMCCLKYEQDVYEELIKKLPSRGSLVKTPEGDGVVEDVEVLRGVIKVKIQDNDIETIKYFNKDDIRILKKVHIKDDDELKELKNLE
ncbi:MAG: stage 0 sporulation family protein [Clostridia bacterium]|nr:stage 0 sporulation family protein [Clostridia bacterium]